MLVLSVVEVIIHKEKRVPPFVGFEHFQGSGHILAVLTKVVMNMKVGLGPVK